MNTAAPIIHTHGEVYHSVVCSVVMLVVVVVLEEAESWARSTNCIKLKTNKLINVLNVKTVADFFIFFHFWLKRTYSGYTPFNNYASNN